MRGRRREIAQEIVAVDAEHFGINEALPQIDGQRAATIAQNGVVHFHASLSLSDSSG